MIAHQDVSVGYSDKNGRLVALRKFNINNFNTGIALNHFGLCVQCPAQENDTMTLARTRSIQKPVCFPLGHHASALPLML